MVCLLVGDGCCVGCRVGCCVVTCAAVMVYDVVEGYDSIGNASAWTNPCVCSCNCLLQAHGIACSLLNVFILKCWLYVGGDDGRDRDGGEFEHADVYGKSSHSEGHGGGKGGGKKKGKHGRH
jgi:hypothetical protein